MRWAAMRLCAAVLLLLAGPAGALPPAWATTAPLPNVPRPIVLQRGVDTVELQDVAQVWVDLRGDATIAQVSRPGAVPFLAADPSTIYRLGAEAALWMHLRLARPADTRQDWVLELPMPMLDLATLYQREDDGGWRVEQAGDHLAVDRWAERGRYPLFRLDLQAGETSDIYLRIRHATAAHFPVQAATVSTHSQRMQREYLVLGAAFGGVLLLIMGCLAKGWVYHDAVFAWYAGYAALTGLAVAAYTGAAAHMLWPSFGALGDAPMPMLACAAVAAAMLFVRNVLALRRRFPVMDSAMLWLAVLGGLMALLPLSAPKSVNAPAISAYMLVATSAALVAAGRGWSRGDLVAKWVFAAYTPMAAAVLISVLRVFGWVPVSPTQYAVVAAMGLEVPLLLVALFIRSYDRHSAQVREQALSSQDALTGLLAPHLFSDRLRQVVARHRRDGQSAAVMYIELVNHGRIREHFGSAVSEQSLLRSVIKLRRLLRDVDTVSRVGEAVFGVVLEGASSRSSVTERATRLIAAGLMPLPGLKPDVTLHFHVAAVMLNERAMEAEEVEQLLHAQLSRMSPRTRRPIRFVESQATPASDPGGPSMYAADSDAQDEDLAAAP